MAGEGPSEVWTEGDVDRGADLRGCERGLRAVADSVLREGRRPPRKPWEGEEGGGEPTSIADRDAAMPSSREPPWTGTAAADPDPDLAADLGADWGLNRRREALETPAFCPAFPAATDLDLLAATPARAGPAGPSPLVESFVPAPTADPDLEGAPKTAAEIASLLVTKATSTRTSSSN